MKKKRDILFLCQFFYPEYISSAQLPWDTVQALKKAGFTVDALCGYPREYSDGNNIPEKETVDGVNIHRLKYIQTGRAGFLGRIINYFSFTFMVLLHLFEVAKYRAVVEGNIICRLMEHINKCVYRRADKVVALSSEMKDYILAHRNALETQVDVIPNWYADQGETERNREENRFRDTVENRFVVSYFGNMGTMQDMDTILGAIRELKDEDIFFLFAGHGNKMEKLKSIVEQEGISNIAIHKFLHGQDFRDALAISDCAFVSLEKGATGLCVPSQTYSYMMQGLPLLAIMDECDIVRDIEAGAGAWVRSGESEKLAKIIRSLKDDPEAVARMRKTCRRIYLENYTTEICTNKYVTLFQKLL